MGQQISTTPAPAVGSTRPPRDTAHGEHYREHTTRPLRPWLGKQPAKTSRLLDADDIARAVDRSCSCAGHCRTWASTGAVRELRSRYLSLGGEHEQLAWLSRLIPEAQDHPRYFLPDFHHEALVCEAAFLNFTGISKTKLERAKELHRKDMQFLTQATEREAPKTVSANAFLTLYEKEECSETLHGIHLPDDITFNDLYAIYYNRETVEAQRASESHFQRVRRTSHHRLHEADALAFGHCALCVELRSQLRSPTVARSPDDLARVKMERDAHRKLRRKQAEALKILDDMAVERPEQNVMIYCDQTPVPAFPREPAAVGERLHRLKLLAGGTLSRSTGTGAVFLSLNDDKGSNLIQTQIFLQLREVMTSPTKVSTARKLYVHADLAGGENRNAYMVGMLGIYVARGWVDVGEYSGLLEYHGACIIDSTVFRPLKGSLAHKPLHTPADFVEAAQKGFKKQVPDLTCGPATPALQRKAMSIVWLQNEIDFKSFLQPCLNHFSGIAKTRAFRVSKGILPRGH